MTRRLDPDQPRLDEHLDVLGVQLDGAVVRAERRRGRVRSGLAAAAVVVAVGLGALVALPGGERLDPVDRARAALADDGGILHWLVAFDFVGPNQAEEDFDRSNPPTGMEIWTATRGEDRWRMRTPDRSGVQSCGGALFQAAGGRRAPMLSVVSPTESAHAPNEMSHYSPWSRALVVQELGAELESRLSGPPMLPSSLGGEDPRDVVQAIRAALERGDLTDRGVVERYGRSVRRLVGTVPQQLPKRPNSQTATRIANPEQLTYYVDAETFAPVELRVRRYTVWSRAGGYEHWKWVTHVTHFLRFERLEDTPANRALLAIDAPPGTAIVRVPAVGVPRNVPRRLRGVGQDRAGVKRCKAAFRAGATATP